MNQKFYFIFKSIQKINHVAQNLWFDTVWWYGQNFSIQEGVLIMHFFCCVFLPLSLLSL